MLNRFIIIILLNLFFCNFLSANIDIKARTAILQDYLSGEILYEKEPDRSIYPASMTKIMTSIIAFDLIKSGDLTLDEKFIISEKAWRLSTAGYSSMFVMVGKRLTKSLIMPLFSGILMLVMYEFGSVLPMLGERIKKKFGEKLSHPTSLKLVTVA